MATIATPRRRARSGRKWWLIIGGSVIVLIIAVVVLASIAATRAALAQLPGWQTTAATRGAIDATINATGNIEPKAEAELRFLVDGNVTKILVKPGDAVVPGQPLAQVDDADLKFELARAEADFKLAQADYDDLVKGATPEEIAEAKARVTQAQAQYNQTLGNVTKADVAAARTRLTQAKERLARLEGGAAADPSVQQAQSGLEQDRSQLAAAKERARLDVEAAANALRNRQDEYGRIYNSNRKLESELAQFKQELPQELKDQEAAALRGVKDAEATLDKSRIVYEEAKQQEIAALQTREASLRGAQQTYNDSLAEARAAVQNAQAELDRLTGVNRDGNVAAARAGIEMAQAQLDRVLADPKATSLTKAQAAVARAEASVQQAQRRIDQTTLTAPFAAVVARIDLRVGESSTQRGVIAIADLSSFHVDVPVDELDVPQIAIGQQVRVGLDALPGQELSGTVTSIDPLATRSDRGTNTYKVKITIDPGGAPVRSGMTATVRVITQHKEGVVLVARRAVRSENGKNYVMIPADGPADLQKQLPAHRRQEVTLGLSNSEFVEIVSGLQEGDKVLVQDVVNTFNPVQL